MLMIEFRARAGPACMPFLYIEFAHVAVVPIREILGGVGERQLLLHFLVVGLHVVAVAGMVVDIVWQLDNWVVGRRMVVSFEMA